MRRIEPKISQSQFFPNFYDGFTSNDMLKLEVELRLELK